LSDSSSLNQSYQPIHESSLNLSRKLIHRSLPISISQTITHDISDGGLATSTQRLAINTGRHAPRGNQALFGARAKPVQLPKLDSFLSNLKAPSFTPWTDVLTVEEIREYQSHNHRKFPLLHLIPPGQSLSNLKSNILKGSYLPGLENDCWRFLVDVSILTAGSPYGKYITVEVFRWYTGAIAGVVVRRNRDTIINRVFVVTGGGSLGLVVAFLISLLLLLKCHKLLGRGPVDHDLNEV
jgi:hypothetical protein